MPAPWAIALENIDVCPSGGAQLVDILPLKKDLRDAPQITRYYLF